MVTKSLVKENLLLVLMLYASSCLFGQKEYFTGHILDSETNEPVVFANIRIKERALGIITNEDGSFRIPLKYREFGDVIEISSMGYQTRDISISELNTSELNILKLYPSSINLDEAVVAAKDKRKKRLSAKQIVQKAFDLIPYNYPSTSFSTIGYYRDYQIDDGRYINLNEAILQVFDKGFDQLDDSNSEIKLFDVVLNKDFEQDSMARSAYDYKNNLKIIEKAYLDVNGGNEFRALRIHDPIRNYNVKTFDFLGIPKNDLVKNHFFLRSSDTSVDHEDLYTIKFWVFYPNYRANGTLYISMVNFAIYKLEYTMYDEKRRNNNRSTNKHGHKQKVIFDITTQYNKLGDQMYLNCISFHNSFIVNLPPVFKVDFIDVDAKDKRFAINYSQRPESKKAIDISNYDILFNKEPIKVRKAVRLDKKVFLYPDLTDDKIIDLFLEISKAQKNGIKLENLLEVKIDKLKDENGNTLNEWSKKEFLQFREFFVQRIKPNSRAPLNDLFMNKNKPFFSNQPMEKPRDFDDYWMNTPLLHNLSEN